MTTNTLEAAARNAWIGWGDYAQWTVCPHCGEWRYCRRNIRSTWFCLECWDAR